MIVVLYTDASIRPLLREAQIAWVARASDGSESCGFTLVDYTTNIAQLELRAVEEGLMQVRTFYPDAGCIHVKSDNQPAVVAMNNALIKSKSMRRIKLRIEKFIYNKLKCRVTYTWIKAHSTKADDDSVYNGKVDKLTRAKPTGEVNV